MTLRLQFVFLLLVLTPSIAAQRFTIEPLQPTSESVLTITVKSIWRDLCTPDDALVTVEGSEVGIQLRTSGTNCRGYEDWEHRIDVGPLDAGLYRVRVYIDGGLYEEAPVWVMPHLPVFAIHEPVAPEAGGTEVSIITPLDFCFVQVCEPVSVTFGGVPATSIRRGTNDNWLIATVPPHAAGAVDVSVSNASRTLTVEKAFLYFSESGPSDYRLFEPILLPMVVDAPGGAGTHWTTETILANPGQKPLITQRALDATRFVPFITYHVARPTVQYPRGYVWLPLRDRHNPYSAALTVRETSRGGAFELPVVREGDFRHTVTLLGIPRDRRYRVSVRIYSLDPPDRVAPGPVDVFIAGMETFLPRGGPKVFLTREREEEPWFAIIPDLHAIPLSDLGRPDLVDQSRMLQVVLSNGLQRLWAVASVVDNETQQTRIITPLK
jgi:hypothetical protein